MNTIRIAIAGNQWITRYLLDKLIEKQIEPSLLITTSPKQSESISGYEDLSSYADKRNIPLYHPQKYSLKTELDEQNLVNKVDILFVFGWQRLIPEWLIKSTKLGVYGVHGGPKPPPRCRGRAVLNWSLILGCKQFYLYLFKITPGVDDGEIVQMVRFDILPTDDIVTLYHKNCVVTSQMIVDNLPKIIDGSISLKEQPSGEPSYMPKREPENSGIYWNQTAERITNLIRAVVPPYPAAFTYLGDKRIYIRRAHIFDTKILFSEPPGTIVEVFPNKDFIVTTKDFSLYVKEYSAKSEEIIKKGATFKLHSGKQLEDPVF